MGNYEAKLDETNRLMLPAAIRKCVAPEVLAEGLFVVPKDRGQRLWLYPKVFFQQIVASAVVPRHRLVPDEVTQDVARLFCGLPVHVDIDKQGRVSLPEREVQEARLEKDVVLVGMDDHIELWSRSAWERKRIALLESQAAIEESARKWMDARSAAPASAAVAGGPQAAGGPARPES